MLGSVHARTNLLSARSSVVRAFSSWPRKFRLVPFVVIAILLFPLIASPTGQAALAQISPGQISPGQTYPAQTYPGQTYPAQTYRAHTHRASHRAVSAEQKALAQQPAPQSKYNEWRLMILGGYPGTAYFNLVHENVLDYADALAALGADLRERLTCVTRLYGEEVHILVGPGAYSIENLSGKKIAVPPEDGNAEFTVRDLLRRLHIDAEVTHRGRAPHGVERRPDLRIGLICQWNSCTVVPSARRNLN